MKNKKLLFTLLSLVTLGVSYAGWYVYDLNFGKDKKNILNCGDLPNAGLDLRHFLIFEKCPPYFLGQVTQKSKERETMYRTVSNLAVIGSSSYFLVCKKEEGCSPFVVEEYSNGTIFTKLRNSELIHDLNYTISPDKKKIVFLHDSAGDNALYLYDIEKQVGIDIVSEKSLKSNETISCEIGSSGMDRYSCGRWIDDTKYVYGIYRKSSENDKKFTLVREETYNLK